jgi:hypothetical protein
VSKANGRACMSKIEYLASYIQYPTFMFGYLKSTHHPAAVKKVESLEHAGMLSK